MSVNGIVTVDHDSGVLDMRTEEDGNLMVDLEDLATVLRFYGFTVTPPTEEGR